MLLLCIDFGIIFKKIQSKNKNYARRTKYYSRNEAIGVIDGKEENTGEKYPVEMCRNEDDSYGERRTECTIAEYRIAGFFL